MSNEQSNAEHGALQNKRTHQFLKQRAIDNALLTKAKMMLSRGVKPGAAALLLRLPVDVLKELYNTSFNPRCRQTEYKSQRQQILELRDKFTAGFTLEALCRDSELPLFTVVAMLKRAGVNDHDIASRMPPPDHLLMQEFQATVERGRTRERKGHRAIKI